MKNEVLNSFYEKLLKDVALTINDDGKVSYNRGDDSVAVMLDGKRLALPTRDNLKDTSGSMTLFHPASEQLMMGPSQVLDALREYIMLRLTTVATHISMDAMIISKDAKLQKSVRGIGNDLIKPLSEVDEKMIDALEKVLDQVGMTPDNRMYNIFLVSGGSKENPRGMRTAKLSYPIMDDAYSEDPTMFFGVKMPRKTRDKPAIVGMLEVLFGLNRETAKNYVGEFTTDVRQAPYFHSLLGAFRAIAEHQNEIIKSLERAAPELKAWKYNLDWIEEYEDFENFVKKVGHAAPLLPGNQGKSMVEEEDVVEKSETTTTSWKDLRDELTDEPEVDTHSRGRSRDRETPSTGWRARFSNNREDRDGGVSFGRGSSRSRRNGFSSMNDREDDRHGRRDRDYDRRSSHRDSYKSGSWRDILRK